ncbi:DUF802 domain-containing protein [Curvibacter lanceolatus]|uniref:DUF802 domain-containing protein n=1 Tax=Curvibacter lanceolatus TaxID=86182 RepID=UPI000365C860|nr:DUF802 domain-containing protein [Curvibacter lanceolatus]
MNRFVFALAFVTGLLSVGWVAWGFVGSSWVALLMTGVIAAVYLLGALEIRRFRAATQALQEALAGLSQAPAELAGWLQQLPLALRQAVRLRVEGERAALPGLALTPYLVGLLVMLGMLGTFLGMVITFKGAVFALEGSTDLQAIRSALAAPIKGLGLSFGTSVAGVAASAMLGLLAALSRRERLQVSRLLDSRVADVLRPFSLSHQREQTYKALQGQSQALPVVADRLQALMEQLEQRSERLNEQLLERQDQFHRQAGTAYTDLAQAVGRSLQDSLSAGARAAGESIQPVVQAAMADIAQQAGQLHQRLGEVAQQQAEGLSAQFSATVGQVAAHWQQALQQQAQTGAQLMQGLDQSLNAFTASFEQRSLGLVDGVHEALRQSRGEQTQADQQRLQAWAQGLDGMTQALQAEWRQLGAQQLAQQQAVCSTLESTATRLDGRHAEQASRIRSDLDQVVARFEQLAQARLDAEAQAQAEQVAADRQRLEAWGQALGSVAQSLQGEWQRVGEQALAQQQALSHTLEQTAAAIGERSAEQAARTRADLEQLVARFEQLAQSRLDAEAQAQAEQVAADRQRLEAWGQALGSVAQSLQGEWQRVGEQALAQQQALSHTLEQTAAAIGERSAEQSARTRADLEQLVARFEQLAQARLDAEAQAQAEQVAADRQRLEAWGQALGSVAQSLQGEWQRVGEQALAQQQALSHTLEQTAATIAERSAEQARQTLAETSRLLSRLDALAQARSEAEIRSQAEQEAADRQRLAAWSQALGSMAGTLQAEWQRVGEQALVGQQQLCQTLEKTAGELGERSAEQARRTLADMTALVARQDELSLARSAAEERWLQQQGERMDQLAALWRQELGALRDDEARRGDAAVQRLGDLQAALASQLATLGQTLEAPMARLMQSAAEVPQAATALLAQVREQMGALDQRDQLALQERSGLMERLNQLLLSLEQASAEQRDSVQALLGQALGTLGQAGQQFTETLSSHAVRAEDLAVHLRGGAIELSSLGEAFHQGVQLFSSSNEKLAEGLQRVETAITQSMARSDEQLAYYVAQAREVIDLSISAQRGIVDDLRRLQAGAQAQAAALGSA